MGLGVVLARHEFDEPGSDEQVRAAGVLLFGGGMNWLVTDRFAVGLSALADLPIGDNETGLTFEAALHAGFYFDHMRWPGRRSCTSRKVRLHSPYAPCSACRLHPTYGVVFRDFV